MEFQAAGGHRFPIPYGNSCIWCGFPSDDKWRISGNFWICGCGFPSRSVSGFGSFPVHRCEIHSREFIGSEGIAEPCHCTKPAISRPSRL